MTREEAEVAEDKQFPEVEVCAGASQRVSKKRSRCQQQEEAECGANESSGDAKASSAAVASWTAAATAAAALEVPGLQSVLSAGPRSVELKSATEGAARKALQEQPPYVHLSLRDSAPQLKILEDRCTLGGAEACVGYRMARATHGVSSGNYYYEVILLPSTATLRHLLSTLPNNVRLGHRLKASLQEALVLDEMNTLLNEHQHQHDDDAEECKQLDPITDDTSSGVDKTRPPPQKKKKRTTTIMQQQQIIQSQKDAMLQAGGGGGCGHLRIGWSMRTGDLQAPVGYDRWSYGFRDILGSRIHNSRREDHWCAAAGSGFGVGDVVGFAICLVGASPSNNNNNDNDNADYASSNNGSTVSTINKSKTLQQTAAATTTTTATTNHIRFFKNGEAVGNFVVSRGIRTGGAAFEHIQPGTYYPAISSYMGAAAQVNFGPYFIYPPRMLPTGMKVRPMSDTCSPPISAKEAVTRFLKERAFAKKTDEGVVTAFTDAVAIEAQLRFQAYTCHLNRHIKMVREARQERMLTLGDLPPLPTRLDENDNDNVTGQ